MELIERILGELLDGDIIEVRIGLHWTAVVARVNDELRCGLASTLIRQEWHSAEADVPQAGSLEALSAVELARMVLADGMTQRSIGAAVINALLPQPLPPYSNANAEQVIASLGKDKTVVLVGRFPFIERLRPRVGKLWVLEQQPQPGEYPAEAAGELLQEADVVAITGMTFVNHTLEGLLRACKPESAVLLLGPSTPLSPSLFDYGVNWISGALVDDINLVLRTVSQGANFRQLHRSGVRLVTIQAPS